MNSALSLFSALNPTPSEIVLALILVGFSLQLVHLWRKVAKVEKIVSNGLSQKIADTREAVSRIEGYIKGQSEKHHE